MQAYLTCVGCAVRESANKSAASAAFPDYVKSQTVIKSAASAASLRGGRASGRLDYNIFSLHFFAALAAKKYETLYLLTFYIGLLLHIPVCQLISNRYFP